MRAFSPGATLATSSRVWRRHLAANPVLTMVVLLPGYLVRYLGVTGALDIGPGPRLMLLQSVLDQTIGRGEPVRGNGDRDGL